MYNIDAALDNLSREFPLLNWNFRPDPSTGRNELISQWLGDPADEIMLCAFKGNYINERFHRQDFFFINFAYKGEYQALSATSQNQIDMKQGDCYIGQPYSGYALRKDDPEETVIVGILIKKETFLNEFLGILAADSALLHFFLEPKMNRFSEGIIKFQLPSHSPVWQLLDLMILEYADRKEDTQQILKTLFLSMTMYLSREYHQREDSQPKQDLIDQILRYIETHSDSITLKELANHFGYHPVYISRMLPEKTGRKFSELLKDYRMKKAEILLKSTDLSIEKIAAMLGYNNSSNFYRAFRDYYGISPRSL